jgi:dihydroneopterin aldolase
MDKIILTGIEFYAYGGVTAAEKQIGQRYRVDIELLADLSSAVQTDDIQHTIHYGHVHDLVVKTARERSFNLLESLAGRIAGRILEAFPVEAVTVRLAKLLPPIDGVIASAAVEITRRR